MPVHRFVLVARENAWKKGAAATLLGHFLVVPDEPFRFLSGVGEVNVKFQREHQNKKERDKTKRRFTASMRSFPQKSEALATAKAQPILAPTRLKIA